MSKDEDHKPESEPDTYDIVEPVDEEPTSRFDPHLAQHPRDDDAAGVDLDIGNEIPPPMDGLDESSGEDSSKPKLLQGIPEPKFVDPQVQASRREQQRIAAAQAAAEEAAHRSRITWTVIGIIAVLAALIGLYLWVF